MAVEIQVCLTCKISKQNSEFYSDSRKRSGLFAECKKCNGERNAAWFAQNYQKVKPKLAENRRRYLRKDKRKLLVSQAKWRAKQKCIEFRITKDDIVWNTVCPVLGIGLNYDGEGRKTPAPNAASIDRVDNSKGYVPGNVVVISHRANAIKRDASIDELEALVRWLKTVKNDT